MEFITLELRPRLQSCNVFIAMRRDFRFKKKVEIKLSESNIILILEGISSSSINFSLPFVKVIPTSLSALSVTSNWIYFRLHMAPLASVYGSFSTEIVTDSSTTVESITCLPPILDDIKLLFKSSECNVLCTCCKNVISKSVNFKRFLPLPDTDPDPDEWFCCQHTLKIVPNDIQPRETDYLYGSYFSILHKGIFADNTVQVNDSTLTCNKCSLHLGMLYTHNLFKVWNCCVDYKSRNDVSSTVNASDPFSDFLTLVNASLSLVFGELGEIILRTSVGKRIHWLRIRWMDRKLNLMTEPNGAIHDTDTDTIFLQRKNVAKVLYNYGTSDITSTAVCAIDNMNVTYHEVSLSMIEAGFKYLLSSTKRLPHIYRTVPAGDCFFGYIALRETINRHT